MKIRVVWVGRTRNKSLAAVSNDLAGRIQHMIGFEIVELRESRIPDDRKRIEAEGSKILDSLSGADFVIALEAGGRTFTSPGFATFISRHMSENPRDLVFVVGGPAGLSDAIRTRADMEVSLSTLTVSHDLARTMLIEQLYRALSIIRNLPYAR
jgi:23S rRNA (pseudouridine1915-N3)-methyltransferase